MVASSESMQYQIYDEVARAFTVMLGRVPNSVQTRIEMVILRSLSGLGDHVPTTELDMTLSGLEEELRSIGSVDAANAVRDAQAQLNEAVGNLGSRSTRAGG
jgi:hypothetical protein